MNIDNNKNRTKNSIPYGLTVASEAAQYIEPSSNSEGFSVRSVASVISLTPCRQKPLEEPEGYADPEPREAPVYSVIPHKSVQSQLATGRKANYVDYGSKERNGDIAFSGWRWLITAQSMVQEHL